MKKFSKDDYQYWLNADFYRLVMEDSRFDKVILVADTLLSGR